MSAATARNDRSTGSAASHPSMATGRAPPVTSEFHGQPPRRPGDGRGAEGSRRIGPLSPSQCPPGAAGQQHYRDRRSEERRRWQSAGGRRRPFGEPDEPPTDPDASSGLVRAVAVLAPRRFPRPPAPDFSRCSAPSRTTRTTSRATDRSSSSTRASTALCATAAASVSATNAHAVRPPAREGRPSVPRTPRSLGSLRDRRGRRDIEIEYKETARGCLAVNLIEC
jgi:hypothetical protein